MANQPQALWHFEPDYRFYVVHGDGSTFSLQTMNTCQALLVTAGGVSQLTATFYDSDLSLLDDAVVGLHPMNVVQLWLRNRFSQWQIAWTGYIDAVHRLWEPSTGDMVQLVCTGPYKLWEIIRQNPQDVVQMGFLLAKKALPSDIFRVSMYAVGFTRPPIVMTTTAARTALTSAVTTSGNYYIDPRADDGLSMWQQFAENNFVDSDLQTWSAIMQGIVGSAGVEFFFDETGQAIWRLLGFLTIPVNPRPIEESEIIQLDLAESDSNVVTRIEVRWGLNPTQYRSQPAAAPGSMEEHLGVRRLVVYAPWLLTEAQAQYYADILLKQYSANVLTGSVTIPADPMFRLGTVISVPTLRVHNQQRLANSYFYVSSISYALAWNGAWNMTLGLTYGRNSALAFPYGITDTLPSWGEVQVTTPIQNVLATTPITLTLNSTLSPTQLAIDPNLVPPGSIVQLRDSSGVFIPPSPTGEYTTVAGLLTDPNNPTAQIGSISTYPIGYLTVISLSAQSSPISKPPSTTVQQALAAQYDPSVPGAKLPTPTAFIQLPVLSFVVRQTFGPTSNRGEPMFSDGVLHSSTYSSGFHIHTGYDMADPTGKVGQSVFAAVSGQVEFAGWDTTGYGNLIIVRTGGMQVYYAHLDSIIVKVGNPVQAGSVIGYEGTTGNSTGPHLHLGIHLDVVPPGVISYAGYVDPKPYIDSVISQAVSAS